MAIDELHELPLSLLQQLARATTIPNSHWQNRVLPRLVRRRLEERDAAQRDPATSITYPYPPELTRPAPSDRPLLELPESADQQPIDSATAVRRFNEVYQEAVSSRVSSTTAVLAGTFAQPRTQLRLLRDLVVATRGTDDNAQLLQCFWQRLYHSSAVEPSYDAMRVCCTFANLLVQFGSVQAVEQLRSSRHAMASAATRFRSRTMAVLAEEMMWDLLLLLEEPARIECMRSEERSPSGYHLYYQRLLDCWLPVCADCGRQSTNWAAPWLGVFLCGRCAYLHTTLTGEAALIKHCSWDDWSQVDVDGGGDGGEGQPHVLQAGRPRRAAD